MQYFEMFLSLFGGLGLFLFGMTMMGDGLENAAGEKLKNIFKKITSNPAKGVLTGALATAIIQSSSATTVMVVGFVNARLMDLYQAAAVIMGANIGTTITALIVTLDIDLLVPLLIGIGALIVMFSKGKKLKQVGNIVLGFGILFLGMNLMKDAMKPLRDSLAFINVLSTLDGNIPLGILAGMTITAIVQSSSATTSMLIALASTGILNLNMAVPILLGCNIGTCITALISSVGTSKTARKAALIHLIFNVFGALIFVPLVMFTPLVSTIEQVTYSLIGKFGSDPGKPIVAAQIANFHIFFNIVNTLVFVPFIKALVKLVNRLVPGEDEQNEVGTKYIDERLLETPVIAVGQTKQEVIRMGNLAKTNLQLSIEAFLNNNNKLIEEVYKNEKQINYLEDEITSFLVSLSKTELNDQQAEIVMSMFHVVNDIERIGDHAENIAELAGEKILKRFEFTNDAQEELKTMFNYTFSALESSLNALKSEDKLEIENVKSFEDRIDSLEKELRQTHIRRLNAGTCTATGGAIFLDIISNLERVGDHSMNIGEAVINR